MKIIRTIFLFLLCGILALVVGFNLWGAMTLGSIEPAAEPVLAEGANDVGGMMTDTQSPKPYWLFYFVVDDIDAGLKRVTDNAGTLLMGPMEVPGGAWIIQARDPQGALFALVGMKKGAAS